jgi:hypothetical protein
MITKTFVLRKEGSQAELNFLLGDSFTLIMEHSHPKEFAKEFNHYHNYGASLTISDDVRMMHPDVIGFLFSNEGDIRHIISANQDTYIMTTDGQLFLTINKRFCMPEGIDTLEKHKQYLKDIGV